MDSPKPPSRNPFRKALTYIGEFLFGGGVIGKVWGGLTGVASLLGAPHGMVPFAIGALIVVGGLLWGGSLMYTGWEQLTQPTPQSTAAAIVSPTPAPPPKHSVAKKPLHKPAATPKPVPTVEPEVFSLNETTYRT